MTIDNQRLQRDAAELQGYLGSGQATRAAAMLQCEYDSHPQEAVTLARAAVQQGSNYPLHVRIDSDGSVSVFDNNITAHDPSGYGTYAVKMSELAQQAAPPPASEIAPPPQPVPTYQPEVQPLPPPTSLYPPEMQTAPPVPYQQQTEIPPPIEQQEAPPQLQPQPETFYAPPPSGPSVGEQIGSVFSGIGEGLGAIASGLLSGGLSVAAGRRGTFIQLGGGNNFVPGFAPPYFAPPPPPYYGGGFQRPWQSQAEFGGPTFVPQSQFVPPTYQFSGQPQYDPSLQSPDGSLPPPPFQFAGPAQFDPSQQSPDGSPLPPPDGSEYAPDYDPSPYQDQFKS